MDLDQLMKKSVDQGVDYLKKHKGSTVVFNVSGGFNFVSGANTEAKELEQALERGIGHSGASFGFALKGCLARAVADLNGKVSYEDKDGKDCGVDPMKSKLPPNAARIVLKI